MRNRDFRTVIEKGWRVSNPFKVITSKSVLDISDNEKYNDNVEALADEQNAKLRHLGYDFANDDCLIHFGKGFYATMTIDDAIQGLALKDGTDLVQFKNGNIGFIGYYNGFNENWFEIIPIENRSEHCSVYRNLIYIYEDELEWVYIIDNEAEVESAVDLVEWSISAWYNIENYPDYEQICIGDVIDERLTDKCICFKKADID